MMQVYFRPDKHWWAPWKRDRYLIEEKDYTVSNGVLRLTKKLKGKIEVSYSGTC